MIATNLGISGGRKRSQMLHPIVQSGLQLIPLEGVKPCDRGWRNRLYSIPQILEHVDKGGNAGIRVPADFLVLWIASDPLASTSLRHLTNMIGDRLRLYPSIGSGRGPKSIVMRKPASFKPLDKLSGYPGISAKTAPNFIFAPGFRAYPESHPWALDDFLSQIGAPPEAPSALLRMLERGARPDQWQFPAISCHRLGLVLAETNIMDTMVDRETWLEFGRACHKLTNGQGSHEWITWCGSHFAFEAWDLEQYWESFDHNQKNGPDLSKLNQIVERIKDRPDWNSEPSFDGNFSDESF